MRIKGLWMKGIKPEVVPQVNDIERICKIWNEDFSLPSSLWSQRGVYLMDIRLIISGHKAWSDILLRGITVLQMYIMITINVNITNPHKRSKILRQVKERLIQHSQYILKKVFFVIENISLCLFLKQHWSLCSSIYKIITMISTLCAQSTKKGVTSKVTQ